MKSKVFQRGFEQSQESFEQKMNEWLKEKEGKITIVVQTMALCTASHRFGVATACELVIFYEETA